MEIFLVQEIIDLITHVAIFIIPFSLVICLTNIIVSFFGDFLLGRKVDFK